MEDSIKDFIKKLRTDRKIYSYDEATAKQMIVLRLLNLTGWDIFNVEEVVPEYSVESRRVDYSLKIDTRNYFFIEVKKPKEDLERHQKQLLDYAFRQGVNLAILTNCMTWWFYLPTKPGDWASRKFYTIDLIEQDTDSAALKFVELLSKENVKTGKAILTAESIYKGKIKRSTIKESLPEAWNKIVSEPESLMVEFLAETTERICGYKPSFDETEKFLIDNQESLVLLEEQILERVKGRTLKKVAYRSKKLGMKNSGKTTSKLKVKVNNHSFEGSSIPALYSQVLKFIVDNGSIQKLNTPWGFGSKRYFVFHGRNPIHPTNREFFAPVTYKNYHLEAHVNRRSGIRYLSALCEEIGFKFKILDS